jgi:hypothetical protein
LVKNVAGDENVEFRIHDRGDPDEDHLGDWQVDDSEDPGDEGARADDR